MAENSFQAKNWRAEPGDLENDRDFNRDHKRWPYPKNKLKFLFLLTKF